jgi:hypothetical protein
MPSNSRTEIVWHQLRMCAKRLEHYSNLVKAKIWLGTRDDLINALADVAEAGEIVRRLYGASLRSSRSTQ